MCQEGFQCWEYYSKKADKVSVQLELTLGGETKINKICKCIYIWICVSC